MIPEPPGTHAGITRGSVWSVAPAAGLLPMIAAVAQLDVGLTATAELAAALRPPIQLELPALVAPPVDGEHDRGTVGDGTIAGKARPDRDPAHLAFPF
jgi:hypothetical protein